MELFRFKKLTEATSGTAIEHDKYRYIKCRNACGNLPQEMQTLHKDAAASQQRAGGGLYSRLRPCHDTDRLMPSVWERRSATGVSEERVSFGRKQQWGTGRLKLTINNPF